MFRGGVQVPTGGKAQRLIYKQIGKKTCERRVREPGGRVWFNSNTDGHSPEGRNLIMPNIKPSTLKLAKMALMVAISVICTFIHFPILPTAPFLEFEVSDIPILIAGFVFGPVRGLIIGVVAILLRALILSPPSGPYGMIMHIIAIGVFVIVASAIYQKYKTKKWGLLSLIIGGLCMTAVMMPANLIITPIFMGVPASVVQGMILPVLLLKYIVLKYIKLLSIQNLIITKITINISFNSFSLDLII